MRTFEQARDFAQQQHRDGRAARSWFNLCQMFSRQCVGAEPFGASAREAFNDIPGEHRHRSAPPPAGSIAYYGDSDRGAGHAVFAVHGGFVWSNDIVRRGRIDRVRWDVFVSRWGLPYRGWIDACPTGDLPVQPTEPRRRYRQGKRVFSSRMRFAQDDSDSVWNLQIALMARGFEFENGPTGYYGSHTRTCCAAFQRRMGWTGADADGIAGPATIDRLGLLWVTG
ncbi:MAG: peptidoglycan-binding domain-containing protein [Actinomycetes bacterium]